MAPPHNIDVRIEAGKWVENLSNWENVCKQAANAVLESQWISDTPTELCILLADDAFVQNLNKQYRGQDTPTNVLSFPTSNNLTSPILQSHLGDVVLALETCLRETIDFCTNSTFSDHICHLVVERLGTYETIDGFSILRQLCL